MKDVLINLGFFREEIEDIIEDYKDIEEYRFNKMISLLRKYNCHNELIKEIIINRKNIFDMDIERIEYILDAIVSNGDIIEETLLDLI